MNKRPRKQCDWCGTMRVMVFDGIIVIRGRPTRARLCHRCARHEGVQDNRGRVGVPVVQGTLFGDGEL